MHKERKAKNMRFVLSMSVGLACLLPSLPVFALTQVELDQKISAGTAASWIEAADALAGGVGVSKDLERAFALYERAAKAGEAEAMFAIAYMLFQGRGVSKDQATAKRWMQQAASQDHPAATQWMGVLSQEDGQAFEQTLGWFKRAVTLNAPGAADSLALFLLEQSATADGLSTLLKLAQREDISKDVTTQIYDFDYLPLLGLEDARYLQQQLQSAGFDPKGLDGQIGPNSRKALSAFRASKGRNQARLTIEDLRDLRFF